MISDARIAQLLVWHNASKSNPREFYDHLSFYNTIISYFLRKFNKYEIGGRGQVIEWEIMEPNEKPAHMHRSRGSTYE